MKVKALVAQSCLTLCNPSTIAHQAPLSMGFPRQEYWSWVAISFSRGPFQPRDQIQVSCIASRFFANWATREAPFPEQLCLPHLYNIYHIDLYFLLICVLFIEFLFAIDCSPSYITYNFSGAQ